eukprot:TRINITY_DN19662_c0_g1_i1.p1 TRINITY_DN19662_c0_g1~~TRINITY_DN19662_c0_g1_i1.p1  ORF type:complete len:333 (-),score=82.42 TRINITY_DN19662_c0_g1_i1:94-1092(-)
MSASAVEGDCCETLPAEEDEHVKEDSCLLLLSALQKENTHLRSQVESKTNEFNNLHRLATAHCDQQQAELEALKRSHLNLEAELRAREWENQKLLDAVAQFESKLYGEGDDTHYDLDYILNSYRRLFSYFIDELVSESALVGKSFKETVQTAHAILKIAFEKALVFKKNLTTPPLLCELEELSSHSKVCSHQVLLYWQKKLTDRLVEIVAANYSENDERLAKLWNAKFTVSCAELAWRCQWHNLNDQLNWMIVFPDSPQNVHLYHALGNCKGSHMLRTNLTFEDLEEIEQDGEGLSLDGFFVIWPMLLAFDGVEFKQQQAFMQIVSRKQPGR